MIPSKEVEEAVSDEHRHLGQDADVALVGLFPRGRNADNDVAKRRAGELRELAFLHRERKHVGRAIDVPIDLVQLMDAFVVG